MSQASTRTVTGVRDEGLLIEDGSAAELHLAAEGEDDVILKMSIGVLQSLAVRATELFQAAKIRTGTTSDPLETSVGRAMGVKAQAPIGGKLVIISILDEHRLEHRFALFPEQSEELRLQMRQAEIDAKTEGRQTRQ